MSERVGTERVTRENGYLYYLGADGYLWRTPTKRNTTGQKAKAGTEKFTREAGYMYFLDSDGYVARAKMRAASPGGSPPAA
ncbi:MAG: hypothetical protein WAN74_06185 [Thermoplasmata archaeon]